MIIPTKISIEFYIYGLNCILDEEWFSETLRPLLKLFQTSKTNLFQKTLKDGILFEIGIILFDHYILKKIEDIPHGFNRIFTSGTPGPFYDYLLHHSENYLELVSLTADKNEKYFKKFEGILEEIYKSEDRDIAGIMVPDINSEEYYKKFIYSYKRFRSKYDSELTKQKIMMAIDFADRVFNDRQLCSFISENITFLFFNHPWSILKGKQIEEIDEYGTRIIYIEPIKWVCRKRWPKWAEQMLMHRERGKCANCGKSTFENRYHIDHIIPISGGGTNDIVNLQILCEGCNLQKLNKEENTNSSIPTYFKRHLGEIQNK
jgi:hypothetical protein